MNPTVASKILAPSKSEPEDEHNRRPELLSGTGTTEAFSRTSLKSGVLATLAVGTVAVRVAFLSAPGIADSVAVDDLIVPASSYFTWTVDPLTKHVYVQAADGSSAYQAWVWRSSM